MCASGYAVKKNETDRKLYCVNPPFTNPAQIGHGVDPFTKCEVIINNADGTITQKTNVPKCGYNKDNKSYCPWALGDAPIQEMIKEAKKYNFYETISMNCKFDNVMDCKALQDL